MTRGRYIIFFLFIAALTAPFAAQILVHQKIKNNRQLMEERMQQEPLVQLSIPVHELQWVKPGKEIRVGNRLFDIKKIHITGQTALLTGLYDEEEKELERKLAGQQQHNRSLQHLLLQLFSGGYYCSFNAPIIVPPVREIAEPGRPHITTVYLSPSYDIAAPPPWLV